MHQNNINVRTYIRTFGVSVLIQACAILQGIIVARLLGPAGRGELAAVILWPSIFASICLFGSNIAFARISAKMRIDDYDEITRTAIRLSLLTASISATLSYLMLPLLLPGSNMHLLVYANLGIVLIPLRHLTQNLHGIDQGTGNFKRYNFTRAMLNPVYLVCLGFIWLFKAYDYAYIVGAMAFSNLVVVICRLRCNLCTMDILGPSYPIMRVLHEGARYALSDISTMLLVHVDKVMVLWLLGTRDLGIYTVALSASAVVNNIANSAGVVNFSLGAQENVGSGGDLIAQSFRVVLSLWLIAGGMLAISMPYLLPFMYGDEYRFAVVPAMLLLMGSACSGLANLLEESLRGQGIASVGLKAKVFSAIIMVIIGYIASRWSRIYGICLAYNVSQGAYLTVLLLYTFVHYDMGSMKGFVPRRADLEGVIRFVRVNLGKLIENGND